MDTVTIIESRDIMVKRWGLLFLIGLSTLSACSNQTPKQESTDTQEKALQSQEAKRLLPDEINHIVIVIEENHSQQEIKGNPHAPYMNELMESGANLTNYKAIEHPSQPNYLDLFSGSNQGVTNDRLILRKFSAPNLASELLENDYTFKGYSEDLPTVGSNKESDTTGVYARKHNPWVNFDNVPKEANQPFKHFPRDFTQLPTISFVIPNLENDMHDGSIETADMWLKQNIEPYVRWAQDHNSLLIMTWDEDDSSQNNIIPTFFVGPMVKKGSYNQSYNHFSMLRTLEDIFGLDYAGKSKGASPILAIWKH